MARSLNAHQIPNGWQYELLDKLAERCSGHTPSKSFPEYWNGGIKWISLADSHRLDKGYVYETDKEISTEGIKNSSANVHPAGTVVISRDAGIGKSGVMAEPMAVSQHFIAWKCDNEQKMNNWYLYNWLQFNKQEFERQAVGSTIKTIGLPFFKKLKISAPPYLEQQKIAKILSIWDKAISTTERLIDNSTQQKKALMQQLLTGKKRLLDDEGRRFECEWQEYPVGEICQSIVPGRNKPKKFDGHIPWVTTPEFQGRYIPSKLQKNYISQSVIDECGAKLVPKGAVVIAAVGDLGLTAMASEIIVLNQQLHAFVCGENVYNEYLFYWLSYQKPYMESIASKTTIQYMNKKNCESIPVKLPTLEEQQKIATVLTNADKEIELLEQQLADLQQEKKALMQQLLTGKKRVVVV